jgi:hypothetical protein
MRNTSGTLILQCAWIRAVQAMNSCKLTRKEGFGTTVNAVKDFLPGFEVFCITKSAINQYESCDCLAPFYAAYDHVLDVMGSSEQADFLRLRGPVTGDLPDQSTEVSAARAWNAQAFVQLNGTPRTSS